MDLKYVSRVTDEICFLARVLHRNAPQAIVYYNIRLYIYIYVGKLRISHEFAKDDREFLASMRNSGKIFQRHGDCTRNARHT